MFSCFSALGLGGAVAQSSETLVTSIEDIKAIESRVGAVVEAVQPATVSLTSDRTGAWGSGVVVNKEGLILTAAHVVQGAKTMIVIFPDGTETVGKVLGANRTKDTAMLQISEKGEYPFAELGDSDELVVGNYLVAMGHAGGHDSLRKPPVRFGRLVSRNVSGFFSSDCTLIGGDSGGPIFDLNGKLVGINSSIGVDLKANNHAGVSGLKDDWDRLIKGDTWGSLGTNPFANSDSPILGVGIVGSHSGGVLIGPVVPNSPADKAGLIKGDIVLSIEDTRVRDGGSLLVEVNRFRSGQVIKIQLKRGGTIYKTKARLVSRGELYQQ